MLAAITASLIAVAATPSPSRATVRTADGIEFRFPAGFTAVKGSGTDGTYAAESADRSAVIVKAARVKAEWDASSVEPVGVVPFTTANGYDGFINAGPNGTIAVAVAILGGNRGVVTIQAIAKSVDRAERLARTLADSVRISVLPPLSGCYSWSQTKIGWGGSSESERRCFEPDGRLRYSHAKVVASTAGVAVDRSGELLGRWKLIEDQLVIVDAAGREVVEDFDEREDGVMLGERFWTSEE